MQSPTLFLKDLNLNSLYFHALTAEDAEDAEEKKYEEQHVNETNSIAQIGIDAKCQLTSMFPSRPSSAPSASSAVRARV